MSITTWETYDLLTELPATRFDIRPVAKPESGLAARRARRTSTRTERVWEVTVKHGAEAEVRRRGDLWNRTRFGVLPMSWTHPDDGAVVVVFDMPALTWRQNASGSAQFTDRLVEWFG